MNDRKNRIDKQLREQVERAIEGAADRVHDATQWWSREGGSRLIDELKDAIVGAARQYHAILQKQEGKND